LNWRIAPSPSLNELALSFTLRLRLSGYCDKRKENNRPFVGNRSRRWAVYVGTANTSVMKSVRLTHQRAQGLDNGLGHARRGRGAGGFAGSACSAASIQRRAFSSKIARSLMSGVSAACLAHSRAKARYSFGDVMTHSPDYTGGSTAGLSATGASLSAAADDGRECARNRNK
jgi:hypothetical protein